MYQHRYCINKIKQSLNFAVFLSFQQKITNKQKVFEFLNLISTRVILAYTSWKTCKINGFLQLYISSTVQIYTKSGAP